LGVEEAVYPDLIEEIDFQKKVFYADEVYQFSMKAWVESGREFLDIISRIPGSTSQLS
jgi:hypothetical protein